MIDTFQARWGLDEDDFYFRQMVKFLLKLVIWLNFESYCIGYLGEEITSELSNFGATESLHTRSRIYSIEISASAGPPGETRTSIEFKRNNLEENQEEGNLYRFTEPKADLETMKMLFTLNGRMHKEETRNILRKQTLSRA